MEIFLNTLRLEENFLLVILGKNPCGPKQSPKEWTKGRLGGGGEMISSLLIIDLKEDEL